MQQRAAGERHGRHLESPTPLVNAHLLEEQSAKLRPDPVWKDAAVGFFEEVRPNKKKNNNKMSKDRRSAPDSKR